MNPGHDIAAMIATVPPVVSLKTKAGKTYKAKTINEIASGGEGRILRSDEDSKLALKVYHPTRTPLSEARFNDLNKLDDRWFVKPEELLYDSNGIPAGFTMKLLSKDYFVIQNVLQKEFCKSNGITLDIKLKIFRALIAAVKSAHPIGVVIGDLNQYNIMCTVKGDVKFLDVDSYETSSYKHSGILLDDIRDYFYGGKVSKNSDYFALSIILFSMICYVHPFKGIHARFKKLSDRMTLKLPVFKADPEIKLPKFYEPLKKGHLLSQFERMYLDKVERFIISIDENQTVASIFATADLPKPDLIKKFQQESLFVQEIMHDEIEHVSALAGRLLVRTKSEYVIYDCSNKGYVSLISRMPRSDWDSLFIGTKTTLGVKDGALFVAPDRGSTFVKNASIRFDDGAKLHQNGNVLFAVSDDKLVTINMDKGYGALVEYTVENVMGQSFNYFGGFFYRAGQHQLFYSNDNGMMSVLHMPINIIGLYQVGKIGMVRYMEKKGKEQRVVSKYYKVKDRNVLLSQRDADEMYHFGFQPGDKGEGFIFQPHNGYMRIIRTDDFEEIARHNLDICTTQTTINHTPSGLVLWEDDMLWLVNKK